MTTSTTPATWRPEAFTAAVGDGVVEMARDHRGAVERGPARKQAGNAVLELVGGRAIRPVNVRVGGFYRAPAPEDLRALDLTVERT
ncbi:hypothetical protein ACPPVO_20400 [Dactylosporangium sp. McL0621]|uniref:hypothetical protein n=1 Tax=Dactylosporangium sp. McL0621 TaxID=3415678 RepID=UPI003CEBBACA